MTLQIQGTSHKIVIQYRDTTWQHQYLLFTPLHQYPFPLSLSLSLSLSTVLHRHSDTERMALRLPTQLATPGRFHHHHNNSKTSVSRALSWKRTIAPDAAHFSLLSSSTSTGTLLYFLCCEFFLFVCYLMMYV